MDDRSPWYDANPFANDSAADRVRDEYFELVAFILPPPPLLLLLPCGGVPSSNKGRPPPRLLPKRAAGSACCEDCGPGPVDNVAAARRAFWRAGPTTPIWPSAAVRASAWR